MGNIRCRHYLVSQSQQQRSGSLLRFPAISWLLTATVASVIAVVQVVLLTDNCQAQNAVRVEAAPASVPAGAVVVGPDGKPMPANPAPGTPPAGDMPPAPGTPGAAAPATPPAGITPVTRPNAKDFVPQAIDQEIRRNPEGKVTFNLTGQPWGSVLQWLADASALSLDWQELPGDFLNLSTTRAYTLPEARDLINRHLLSRGYSMLLNGEVLSIVKVKELNPSLVPRVKPEELAGLSDHTLCKISFDLDWLIADEAVEELKPMLSSAGQIHKLSRTNRLEVIDTAASLRDIWELLQSEQSDAGHEQLVKTFRLKHRRAEEVMRLLMGLLGIEEKESKGSDSSNPNMMQMQIQQQMQQMQQQMQQAAQAAGGGGAKKKSETRLVLNQRENMILVQAAPDQMATIERAIQEIDVEGTSGGALVQNLGRMKVYRLETIDPQILADLLQQLGDLEPGTVLKVDKKKKSIIAWASLADHLTITTLVDRLDQSARTFEVIQLRRLDAEYVAGTIGGLLGVVDEDENKPSRSRYDYFYGGYGMQQQQEEPKERGFKVDADLENNRILVYANPVEMDEIRHLLQKLGELPDPDRLDNGIRVFDLSPDENPEQLQERLKKLWHRGNSLDFESPENDSKNDTKGPSDKPAAETTPDTANGRNGNENAEPDAANGPTTTIRSNQLPDSAPVVTTSRHGKSSSDALKNGDQTLQSDAFHEVNTFVEADAFDEVLLASTRTPSAPNLIAGSSAAAPESPAAGNGNGTDDASPQQDTNLTDSSKRSLQESDSADQAPENVYGVELQSERSDGAEPAPVRLAVTEDGRLIASSDDAEALAELEELLGRLSKARSNYKVFRLKHATASWITLTLKDYFKAEEQTTTGMEYNPWFGYMPKEKKVKGNHSLSRRRQPSFISDNYTSTILVRDADARQLQTIDELIALYDVPEPSDTKSMRINKMFRLQNARAKSVADAVKDVFRDLLSSNDKALESKDPNARPGGGGGGFMMFPPGESSESDDDQPINFKGLLSIGVDESSNTLIVSSTATLMSTIGAMIEELDKAATSTSVVQVIKVDSSVDLALIQERLDKLLNPTDSKQPKQPNNQPPNIPGQPPGGTENPSEGTTESSPQ